jgi:pimeloyl-ACP methyl ester carboxylesterase
MQEREIFTNNISTTVRFEDFWRFTRESLRGALLQLTSLFPGPAADWALRLFSTPRIKSRAPKGVFVNIIPETIEVEGVRAKVYQFGDEELPKVLIVHGWEGLAQDFYVQVEELLSHGYGVITFDGPAHHPIAGELGTRTNALEFAKIISHLALVHGPFAAIVAHSFGGFATSLALAQHQRLVAERLIMIGSPNRLSRVLDAFCSVVGLPPQVRARMDQVISRQFDLVVEDTTSANNLKAAPEVEVMIVHDENDEQVPSTTAQEMAAQIPGSTLLITQGLGHNRILRNREVALTLIQFISGRKP